MSRHGRYMYAALGILVVLITVVGLVVGCSPAASPADAGVTAQTKQLYASVDTKSLIRKFWVDSAKDTPYGKDIVINGVKSTFHEGVAYRYPGLPVMLEVSGDYYEMGLQYGVLLRPEIYKAMDAWGKIIEIELVNGGLDRVDGFRYMYEPAITMADRIPSRFVDEMRGIADATGIPLGDIEAYSLMYDVGRMYSATSCGGVLLKGADGTVIHARVRDCSDGGSLEHAKWECVIRHKPKGYNSLTEIGWPGIVGGIYQGWNDKGITVAHNTTSVRQPNNEGFPSGLTTRIILEECASLAEAETVLSTHLPVNGFNCTVSDQHAGTGAVFEMTPTAYAKRELKDNKPVWVFNDITDPGLYPQQTGSKNIGFTPAWGDTNSDRWRIAAAYKIRNEYTIDDGLDAMAIIAGPDGSDYSWSGTRQGISNWMTDVCITYDPHGKGMYLGLNTSYASRGNIYYIDNDFSKQPTLYRKAVGVSKATQDYADIRQNLYNDKDRIKQYVELAAKYPDDAQAQFMAAYHPLIIGQPDKYVSYFEKAYSMKPGNIEYKLFAGLAAMSSKNYDKAISLLEDVKSSDIYPAEELYRLTALQKAWKDKDQAKSDQYGQQINAIVEKYKVQNGYKSRIIPLINALGSSGQQQPAAATTATPAPVSDSGAPSIKTSFASATYTDSANGFSFQYPATWIKDATQSTQVANYGKGTNAVDDHVSAFVNPEAKDIPADFKASWENVPGMKQYNADIKIESSKATKLADGKTDAMEMVGSCTILGSYNMWTYAVGFNKGGKTIIVTTYTFGEPGDMLKEIVKTTAVK